MNFFIIKRISKIIIILFVCLFAVLKSSYCFDKGIAVTKTEELSHISGKVGNYYAIIIGIDNYLDSKISDLNSAVKDAVDMSKILKSRYGFSEISLLINSKATRYNIDNLFRKKIAKLKTNDNLLIYFSGHGDIDRQLGGGWWIPVDAKAGVPSTYIDNTLVQKYIKYLKARHVLLISDSCYSGTLFGETREVPPIISNQFYLNLYNEKSRWGLTSGNITPVTDQGTNGHSIFAYQLLKILNTNCKPFITPREIYSSIGPIIRNNSDQMPVCRPIKNTGDQGGEFVFILKANSEKKFVKNIPIYIETQPSTANIFINEQYKGKSPINITNYIPGIIKIEIKKKNYKTITKTINSMDKLPKHLIYNLNLKMKKGNLYVKVNLQDARIRILNIRPVFYQGISLNIGEYRLEVSKNGYKKYDKWITIIEGQNTLEVTLYEKQSKSNNNLIQNSNIDSQTTQIKMLKTTHQYNQKKILELFKKDYSNNNNLSFSYRILLNYLEELGDDQYNIDIALFTGAYYKEIVLEKNKIISDLKFLDNNNFYFTVRKGKYNQNWKFFKYNLTDKSTTFIYSDEGKMFFQNREEIFVLKNNKPYIFNLKSKTKKYLGFKMYNKPHQVVMSPNKKYISYIYSVKGEIQLFLYNLLEYKVSNICFKNNKKEFIHFTSPFFSYDSNYLFYRKAPYNKSYEQIIEYDINSKNNKVLLSEKRLVNSINYSKNYLSDQKYFIYSTHDEYDNKKKIKVIDNNTKKMLENISLDSSDDSLIRYNKNTNTLFFFRNIYGFSGIWGKELGSNNYSIPIMNVENFRMHDYDISPNGKYLIYSSKHSGKESLYLLDISKKNINKVSVNCKTKLKQLINREEARCVVYDFIYEAIINKNNYKGQFYILKDSQTHLFDNLKNKQSWHDYLYNIGYHTYKNTVFNTMLDGKISVESIIGGCFDENAFFTAILYCKIPEKFYGREKFNFTLRRNDDSFKIVSIQYEDF